MGINMNVLAVYGIRLDWDEAFYEAYEEIEEALCDEFGYGKPVPADRQIEAKFDCYSGDYMILGEVLYDSGDFRWCDNMNDYQEIDMSNLLNIELEYKEKFARLYPEHVHLLERKDFKLINFIHYT